MKFVTHYTFDPSKLVYKDYSELITVPDLVLSMQEIYERYSVRGDISGLANGSYPHTVDDLDMDDSSVDFVPEEDVDVLQYAHELRMRQPSQAHPASEDKPQEKKEESSSEDSSPKPQTHAGDNPELDAGSE